MKCINVYILFDFFKGSLLLQIYICGVKYSEHLIFSAFYLVAQQPLL